MRNAPEKITQAVDLFYRVSSIKNASQGEGFNHKVERMHSNIGARTKTMGGFHGSKSK